MKTTTLKMVCRTSLLFISILAIACKKDSDPTDEANEHLYTLTFDLRDFDASTRPLNSRNGASSRSNGNQKASSVTPQAQMGYLYFWSFNGQSLHPDIASHSGASITYESAGEPTFPNGWKFENYPAGSALSIRGLSDLTITLPLAGVTELAEFGFDIASSGTGPKDFSLAYRFDKTSDWYTKSEQNQFINTNSGNYPKNNFIFDFSDLPVENKEFISLKIIPKAGNRGDSGDYNQTQGVIRFDNIYLTGSVKPPSSYSVDELHYYVFDAVNSDLIDSDVKAFDPANPSLNVSLPYGHYQIVLARNHSVRPLLVPSQNTTMEEFYYSNVFSNHLANIFACEATIVLEEDQQLPVVLERHYSQIKFEFTDIRDLSHISKIVVSQQHQPFFYAPFQPNMTNPVLDQSDIVFHPELEQSKEILFHQFMGKTTESQEVNYRLDVYGDDDEFLRTIEVAASVKNNVQLVFRGELLSEVTHQSNFQISFNENWAEEVRIEF